ncbi:uncharacterized protein FA14DRAFT_162456 [Meira miltonrushii]|uniref:Copper-fist domain-containing protein n=1 Tax=Meira miltonrushii TaxID=1280837 RepID=A0A316V5I9_9BASI|nr:uncharacterized protein FA14DRAFT_162456 [Meira miltonrushii]PWN32288.1 hypothetical protein FA14DRAFT_162456 [Meira miltonrushii]
MVLINGRKFACEACIRGHRASNCSHTGRKLQLVRKKGRPSSQCDVCRSKRANGSFHGRCDCGEDEDITSPQQNRKQRGKSEQSIETFTPFLVQDEASLGDLQEEGKSKHSLQSLMNPCQCKTTGICSCCSRASSSKDGIVKTASVEQPASCGCNGENQCCDDGIDAVQCAPLVTEDPTLKAIKRSCCGSKTSEQAQTTHDTPILDPVASIMPMTTEEADAILAPDCHCGPDCACPGCLMENEDIRKKRKQGNEECPDKCLTCSACVLGLTRPSGIEAVDAWMEQDKQNTIDKEALEKHANDIGNGEEIVNLSEEQTSSSNAIGSESEVSDGSDEASSSSVATAPESSSQKSRSPPPQRKIDLVEPPLPPFPSARKYFEDHFLNPERRRFFADQIQTQSGNQHSKVAESLPHNDDIESEFGERLDGETDEEWQARHGFQFLTPDAIKIFDHAKRFREEKRLAEEEEESSARREEEDRIASTEKREGELSLLRQRALSAHKRQKTTAS